MSDFPDRLIKCVAYALQAQQVGNTICNDSHLCIIRIQSALDFMGTYDQRVQRGGGSFQNAFRSQFTTRPNSSNRNAIGKQGS